MRIVQTVGLAVQRHGPTIMTVAGVVGVVGGGVLACKATIKAETIIEDCKLNVNLVKDHIHEEKEYNRELCSRFF